MAYTRTDWVSGETPLSADNMNNIEDGIEELNSNLIFITPPPDGTASISDNVIKNLAYIDLPPGSYIVFFNAMFDVNSTGSRSISISDSSTSIDTNWFLQSPGSPAGSLAMQLLRTLVLASETRIYFTARILAPGITLNVRHHIVILKLK